MPQRHQHEDQVRETTLVALSQLMEPLLELMFDVGITVSEFNKVVRAKAARVASKRVLKASGRSSKSRVAVITGLPRSEIAKILNSSNYKTNAGQHVLRRILQVWFENPRFLAKDGTPTVLPIFGGKISFQKLVESHGAGLPIRAVLDELIQLEAIELLVDQRVRAKSRTPKVAYLNSQDISAFGERARDMLETLALNARKGIHPHFEATSSVVLRDADAATRMAGEIAAQAKRLIDQSSDFFRGQNRKIRTNFAPPGIYRVGVSAYCFRQALDNGAESSDGANRKTRKNLRRKKQQSHSGLMT